MKICPKCDAEHKKPGTFCSRKCANSRGPRSNEFKQKVSEKLTGRTHNHSNGRGGEIRYLKEFICLNCEMEFTVKANSSMQRLFCSHNCHTQYIRQNKTEKEEYYRKCKFKFNTYDYPEYFDNSLFEKYGRYQASNRGNNLTGISRDHAYSISEGFKNNIDPSIISHPANCILMQHQHNSKKNTKCSMTLDKLLEQIENFNEKYMPE